MLDAEKTVRTVGERALVAVVVTSEAPTPRGVVVDPAVEDVSPPRRAGVPERGWRDGRFEGAVPAGGTLAVGFATGEPPPDPPATVTDRGRVDGPPPADPADAVVRALGDPRPPRAAVPVDGSRGQTDDEAGSGADSAGEATQIRESDPASDAAGSRAPAGRRTDQPADGADLPDDAVPDPVADWLAAVAARADAAEALATADGVTDAGPALAAAEAATQGEAVDPAAFAERVAADGRALRAVADRAVALADRCESADVPVAALERLA